MTYWIVVGSEENMRIAESRGFDIFGFKSTRRSEVSSMKPGDKLIFYLTKIMKFGGLAEVTSEYFEDHAKVFKSESPVLSGARKGGAEGKPGDDYPFRVKAKPLVILQPDQYLDVRRSHPRWRSRGAGAQTGAWRSRATSTRSRRATTRCWKR